MKTTFTNVLLAAHLWILPAIGFAQSPDMGSLTDFVLFSVDGAVSNTGNTHLTGKVGTNYGSNTGFGNVNGGMHAADGVTAEAAADLLVLYGQLNGATPDFFPTSSLGNGQTLNAGIYAISGASTLNGELILDGQDNNNASFLLQISGPFSTAAGSKVTLINGAKACNVFWKVEGLVDMAAGTTMRGTVVANNAAINFNSGDVLEGRALTTGGAITVDGALAYTPSGCGSPVLTGPAAPLLGEAGCYGLFSSDGPVENAGITNITGDVGCNVGLTTGFDPLTVTGTIHPIPDNSTAQAAADLLQAYNHLNGQAHDIELLYPAQFGNSLVLTPHTYVMEGAVTFTDTVYLNAQGVANAVFVIKINGALETSVNSNVVLMNGAQAKNVFWLVNGAVDIFDHSVFNGSIVSQGAINLFTGVQLNGRALSGVGALSVSAMTGDADITIGNCSFTVSVNDLPEERSVQIYPNPMGQTTTILLSNMDDLNTVEFRLYNVIGVEVMQEKISSVSSTIETGHLQSGVYIYRVTGNGKVLQTGKLVSL